MNKRFFSFCFSLCLLSASATAQHRFRMMEWNVENLFDTCHDVGKNDFEFLPTGRLHWTSGRYVHKLRCVAQVICNVGQDSPPDLVALCEVENDSVLMQLTRRSVLARLGYSYVMTHSPDARGVDVALLFQPGRFRIVAKREIEIQSYKSFSRTRNILHVTGLLPTQDTLDVFVCHLPSRVGGYAHSEDYRCFVMKQLRRAVDSLSVRRQVARIVVTGDCNDEFRDAAISQALGVQHIGEPPYDSNVLYALTEKVCGEGVSGTYRHGRGWNVLDHMFVSGSLLNERSKVHVLTHRANVFTGGLLTTKGTKVQPRRTYLGGIYMGGLSDHLPLFVDFDLAFE